MGDTPKRPLSAFMIYMNDHREQIKNDNPGIIRMSEISKRGGELWRALNDKSEWEQKAAEAKDRYANLIKEFVADGESNNAAPADRKRKRQLLKLMITKSKKKTESDEEEYSEYESD